MKILIYWFKIIFGQYFVSVWLKDLNIFSETAGLNDLLYSAYDICEDLYKGSSFNLLLYLWKTW